MGKAACVPARAGDVDGPQAFCPAGKVVVGSGFYNGVTNVGFVESFGGTSVGGGFVNTTTSYRDVEVQAICAPGSASASAATAAKAGVVSRAAVASNGARCA
jgi:hypothetical protein